MNASDRNPAAAALPVAVILVLTFSLLLAADAAWANVRVNQDGPGLDQHTTSITLHPDPQGGPDLLIVGYDDNPFGFNGIGTSWSPDGVSWFDSVIPVAPVFPVNMDASVASDRAAVVYAGFASYDVLPPFNSNSGIFVSASFDGGQTFNQPVGVSVFGGGPGAMPWETKPKVDADGYHNAGNQYAGNVYAIWERDLPTTGWMNGPSDVGFSRSLDQGLTWSLPLPINDTPGNDLSLWPDLDIGSDGSIAAGWVDAPFWIQHQGTLITDRSLDGGVSFGQDVPAVSFWCIPQTLNDLTAMPGLPTHVAQSYAAMAVDPSNPLRIGAVFAADPDNGPAGEARVDTGDMAPSSFDASLINPLRGASNLGQTSTHAHACWIDTRGLPRDVYYNRMPLGSLPPTWSGPETLLSNQPLHQHHGSNNANVATSGSGVYVAWDEWSGIDFSNLIWVNCSNDEGATWLPQPIALDSHGRVCYEPWVTVNSMDFVTVAWLEDQLTAGDTDIYVSYSSDGGATWQSPEIQVPTAYKAFNHDIASWYDWNTGSHMVYLTWAEGTASGTGSTIQYSVSSDGGATWLTPRRLDNAPAGSELAYSPKICTENGNVYVTWVDRRSGTEDIMFNWSAVHGVLGWIGEVQLDQPTSRGYCSQIACGQGNVYVVYESDRNALGGNEDIYCNFSVGGGSNWQGERRIDTDAPAAGHSACPRLTVGGVDSFPMPYVVWMDDRNGAAPFSGWDAYSNFSADGGFTWGVDFRIDVGDQPGLNDTWYPQVDGMNPVYLYRDLRNGPGDIYGNVLMYGPDEADVFYTESLDGGVTWLNPPLRVNDDPGWQDQTHPWLDIKPNGTVDVVWYDKRGDPLDRDTEVFFAALLPGAPTFTLNMPISNQPIVAPGSGFWMGDYIGVVVDDVFAHVAWADNRREGALFDVFSTAQENPQLEEYGACCLPDGTCAQLNGQDCAQQGGLFMGSGVPCTPNPCVGTGLLDDHDELLGPGDSLLRTNYPNPFNPSTTIRFDLGGSSAVRLTIHDAAGRVVTTLIDAPLLPAGRHEAQWNGRDRSGRIVAAGVYLCCLDAGGGREWRRMVLLK